MMLFYFTCICLFYIYIDMTNSTDSQCFNFNQCGTCEILTNKSITIRQCKDSKGLDEHLNELLSNNSALTSLTLENINLINLNSVCRMIHLSSLELVNNNLGSIPTDCFNDFKSIKIIKIASNKIKVLRKGTFQGLNTLEHLILEGNIIEHIDDEVFSNTSDLLRLNSLNLMSNNLTSVGAWIFIRGLSAQEQFLLDLGKNKISKLTNHKNWSFTCKDRKPKNLIFNIDLARNNIQYLTDLINPYFRTQIDFLCFIANGRYKVSIRLRKNSLKCDCVDYQYLILARRIAYAITFDDLYCSRPVKYQDVKPLSIPPEKLICESRSNCVQGCVCVEQPSTSKFYVYCNNSYSNNSLPQSLPQNKLHKYVLNFGGNHIKGLESKEYFIKTVHLDISNSNIRSISNEFFLSIKHIDYVYLHDNKLSSLPKEACLEETFSFKELTLYNNPWNCSCDNMWMKAWLNKSIYMLKYPEGIYCGEPYWNKNKKILTLDELDFCRDPYVVRQNRILMATLIPVFASLLIISVTGFLIWRFKIEIHSKLGFHPFDRDECEGENMIYDVFISSSYQDRLFAISLVKKLEKSGYRVCYHEKDFLIGPSIASNICRAVFYSKRVVCLLSDHFLMSPYCVYEFQAAIHRHIEIKKNRLIAMLYDFVEISKDTMPEEMYEFLMSHTYVEVNDEWMTKLLYSLTVKKIKTYNLSLLCDYACSG